MRIEGEALVRLLHDLDAKTRTTEDLVILFSSHGRLTFVSLENPGVYLQDEFDVLVDPTDLSHVEEALDAVGYLVATEDSLSSPYDGRTVSTRFPTWEERYFGYP